MARRFVLKSDSAVPERALSIDYAGALNAQQHAAVVAGGGGWLVVAGAGTGKTRTLVYRVAYLVETGVLPEEILLLTFTRRAAREMLTRAALLLDGRCERVQGGTFHAFCLAVLRRYAGQIGFPQGFTILDAADAADVIDVLRAARGLHRAERRFPRKKTLQGMFSAATNRNLSLAELLEAEYPQFLAYREELEALQTGFEQYKRQYGLMDYDDLLQRTLELFAANETLARKVSAACRHVLVDEYQDTNRLQARLVRHFAAVHGNVMAVGDDAQSIYRFRGADFRNIIDFPEHFPGARVLKLEHNYRSTQPILDLANHVLAQAREKYAKKLFSDRTGGELPALVQAPDDRFQSRFVAQMILQLREEGVSLDRMAVLFRRGHDAYDLEVELARRGIPFVKYGGIKLSEAAHIKDVLAYLKIVENPRDAVAWNRVLQLLEGIGPKTAQDLIAWITTAQDPFTLEKPYASARYVDEIGRLTALLRALRDDVRPLQGQVDAVVAYYEPVLKRKYYEDYPKRWQDLERFSELVTNYRDRADFLSTLALDPLDLTALGTESLQEDEPPLVLSTIHSAKGLEFHTVFVIQVLDGILPSAYALQDPAALDEELRLLYVALTRAEQNLFLTYPVVQSRRWYGDYFSNPSRFLNKISERLLEPWSLAEEPAPGAPAPDREEEPPLLPF